MGDATIIGYVIDDDDSTVTVYFQPATYYSVTGHISHVLINSVDYYNPVSTNYGYATFEYKTAGQFIHIDELDIAIPGGSHIPVYDLYLSIEN
jgi:hypothetical protein